MNKNKKTGLGRGLSALIPEIESSDENDLFIMCPIEDITPNRYQPRKIFNEAELEKLKDSIAEQGVLQPLLVRNFNNSYELIAGERRLRAAKAANLTHVPVFVKQLTDEQMLEVSIIENIQREDLNVLEEAQAYYRLIKEFGYTQEKVAQKIGKNRSTIANLLRLLGLPDMIKASLIKEEITMGHARALLGSETPEQQIYLFKIVVARQLSVRQTERLVNQMKQKSEKSDNQPSPAEKEYLEEVGRQLSDRVHSRVIIKKTGHAGKIEINFKTQEEFDRLVHTLSHIE